MNDVSVIDRFLDVFSRYIDSGFGLLSGEVAFLTATLVAIDVTLAGLFWAMSHASGQGDDVMARLVKKVLYVGAFAYILGNFNRLAGIVFNSFASLGLTASGSGLSQGQLLQPGRLAQVGIDAGRPIMAQISDLTGFPEVFANLDVIAVLFLAWLVLIVCFFVLAVQLFVTLIEFKLTTLAGFVLVPFALWNKTSFLAEKVLGNANWGLGPTAVVLHLAKGDPWVYGMLINNVWSLGTSSDAPAQQRSDPALRQLQPARGDLHQLLAHRHGGLGGGGGAVDGAGRCRHRPHLSPGPAAGEHSDWRLL